MAINYRFLVRGGTAANLAAVNEVPLARELVFETDSSVFKLGDGLTPYNSLPNRNSGGGGGGGSTWLNGAGAPAGGLGADGDYYIDTANGNVYQKATGAWGLLFSMKGDDGADGSSTGQILFGAGDGINLIAAGAKAGVQVTFAGEIKSIDVKIRTNDGLTGSIVLDLWKCSHADYGVTRPDVGDSIVAAAPPTITAGSKMQDATLTGWAKTFAPGDFYLPIVVSRSSNVCYFAFALETEKTP